MRWYKVILAVCAGLLLWASFPPVALWLCAALGIALFAFVVRDSSLSTSAMYGVCVGLGFFVPLFYWTRVASGSIVAWIALAFFESLFVGLVGICWHLLSRSRVWGKAWFFPGAAALVWGASEQLRATVPFGGMPWGLLGFGQVSSPFAHLAPYGSTQLVGGAVVACGVLAASVFVSGQLLLRRSFALVAACAIPVVCLAVPLNVGEPSGTLRVAYAQGIVARADEDVEGSRSLQVTRNIASEVRTLKNTDFDLLVLPESTSDRDIRVDDASWDIISDIADYVHSQPILLGTQEFVDDYRLNDYVLVYEGSVQARYSKQHPAPFGEYLPWRSFFLALNDAAQQIAIDMKAGQSPAVLDVPIEKGNGESTVRVAVPICFEVGDSAVLSQALTLGASLIVVPTNNASFGDTAESRQQFDMTRFRAIEYGRDAIQISTVGVSGAIGADGRIVETTEPWTAASSVITVSVYDGTTVSARFYPHIVWIVFLLAGVILSFALVEYIRTYRRTHEGGQNHESARHHSNI